MKGFRARVVSPSALLLLFARSSDKSSLTVRTALESERQGRQQDQEEGLLLRHSLAPCRLIITIAGGFGASHSHIIHGQPRRYAKQAAAGLRRAESGPWRTFAEWTTGHDDEHAAHTAVQHDTGRRSEQSGRHASHRTVNARSSQPTARSECGHQS